MNLIRWQRPVLNTWPSFGRLSDLRDEIDRLFDESLTRDWPFDRSALNELAIDLSETDDAYVVEAFWELSTHVMGLRRTGQIAIKDHNFVILATKVQHSIAEDFAQPLSGLEPCELT